MGGGARRGPPGDPRSLKPVDGAGHGVAAIGRPDRTLSDGRPPVALYVHVPFCVSICPYCDFVVYAGRAARGPQNRVGRYLQAVEAELDLRADVLDGAPAAATRPPLDSVYLGGGTPSLLPPPAVGRLLARVAERFGIAGDAEITLEANPGPDETGDLAGFVAAGVNRVSFGAQSLQAAELRTLGRRHSPRDVRRAVAAARAAGVRDVSIDLLYDVPGQTVETWAATLDAALDLETDHLSAYALSLDDPDAEGSASPLGDHLPARAGALRWRGAARRVQDADRAADMYEMADERLSAAGFRWYELSNWSRPGRESRHNLAYWRHQPYEAAGPGAHAFDGLVRRWNAARLDAYLDALAPSNGSAPTLPPGASESLDAPTLLAERAMLALRLREGLGGDIAQEPSVQGGVAWALSHGLAERVGEVDDGRIRLSLRGRLLSNEVFTRLLPGAAAEA